MLRAIVNGETCRLLSCSAPNSLPFLARIEITDKDPKSPTFKSSGSMSGQKHPVDCFPWRKCLAKVHSHDREAILVIQTGHCSFCNQKNGYSRQTTQL